MAQNKTFIPGMEDAVSGNSGLYQRGSGNVAKGTYVPGMQNSAPAFNEQPVEKREDPVVGFLYSISRKGIGEYWPLHLGKNTIGRSADCPVRLRELSVSDIHAVLSVKQMKTTGALIATIRDEGSKNGMYVNDEELDYDNHPCKNGDIITVGTSYQLLLILINAKELGLTVSESFVPDEEENAAMTEEVPDAFNPYSRSGERRYEGGTVDLSGGGFEDGGSTKVL